MATRTISSPGVQVTETDLSIYSPNLAGTNILITGFAKQGPVDEIITISSKQELSQIYGIPTTPAERYFYNSVKEVLNSPATVYTARLGYGTGLGDGFGSKYSALAYPVQAVTLNGTLSTDVTHNLNLSSCVYVLGAPIHFELTQAQYNSIASGNITWSLSGSTYYNLTAVNATSLPTELGRAGIIVLNKSQSTINSQFEGYYIGMKDNTGIYPDLNYDSILGVKSLSLSGSKLSAANSQFTDVPSGVLQFTLSSQSGLGLDMSISRVMENLTDYNINGSEDDDLLNIGVFKLRKSVYATEAFKLDYVLEDKIVGAIDSYRTQINPDDSSSVSMFLENIDDRSRNIEILVNPYISNKYTGTSQDSSGVPQKKVRMFTRNLFSGSISKEEAGFRTNDNTSLNVPLKNLVARLNYADYVYPIGAYTSTVETNKITGNIPSKLERVLELVRNDEIYDIDIMAEAGLGTVYAMTSTFGYTAYDDTLMNSSINGAIEDISSSTYDAGLTGWQMVANYTAVFNAFENVCNLETGRGDCFFVADPIRQILIQGKNTITQSDKSKPFTTFIYWPLRNQFSLVNTSYAGVYANWIQSIDDATSQLVWNPPSGYIASKIARTTANRYPWTAVAGFNDGILTTAVGLALTPNQRQRDELYKASLNPVTNFPAYGNVIFGQKTLSKKPSAFDRVNVRRLFQVLEKQAKRVAKFFVFQPNNEFTRTRLVNTLTPIFERAKATGGLYDYAIVCNGSNNTAQVIDNNELVADIYIKPTKTAEFILLNFVATRTDANFSELVGQV